MKKYILIGVVSLLAACNCKAQESKTQYVMPLEEVAQLACDLSKRYHDEAMNATAFKARDIVSVWAKDTNLKFEQRSYDLFNTLDTQLGRASFSYQECVSLVIYISRTQFTTD